MSYIYSDELYHHGVKGQKWGVRKDIAKSTKEILDESSKMIKKIPNKKRISYSHLTDAEIKKRVNRLRLEKEYASLSGQNVSVGKERVTNILAIAGSVVGIAASSFAIIESIKRIKG